MWNISQSPQVRDVCEPASFNLGEFSERSLISFEKALHKAYSMDQPIFPIRIQSDGGRVDILFAMMGLMKKYREEGMKFAAVVSGMAASAGCCIFLYSDFRYMGDFSTLLFHSFQLCMEGALPNVKANLDWSHAENERMNEVLSKHLGKNKDWLKNQLKKNKLDDWQISPQTALELGMATNISIPQFNLQISSEFSIS